MCKTLTKKWEIWLNSLKNSKKLVISLHFSPFFQIFSFFCLPIKDRHHFKTGARDVSWRPWRPFPFIYEHGWCRLYAALCSSRLAGHIIQLKNLSFFLPSLILSFRFPRANPKPFFQKAFRPFLHSLIFHAVSMISQFFNTFFFCSIVFTSI